MTLCLLLGDTAHVHSPQNVVILPSLVLSVCWAIPFFKHCIHGIQCVTFCCGCVFAYLFDIFIFDSFYEQQFVKSVCSESIWTVNRFSILFAIYFSCLSFLCFSFNSPAICGFLGFLFFNKSRTEQQTTLRILFAYYTIWSLPSESNGRYRASHGLELHFHYLRRKQLRHQGECVHVCILC